MIHWTDQQEYYEQLVSIAIHSHSYVLARDVSSFGVEHNFAGHDVIDVVQRYRSSLDALALERIPSHSLYYPMIYQSHHFVVELESVDVPLEASNQCWA